MANNESRIPQAAAVLGVEDPERLLRHFSRVMPTAERTLQIETRTVYTAQEQKT